jgi:hypothetical protein
MINWNYMYLYEAPRANEAVNNFIYTTTDVTISITEKTRKEYYDLELITEFLRELKFSAELSTEEITRLSKKTTKFFVRNGKLYQWDSQGRYQRVIKEDEWINDLTQIHDELGHKGFFPRHSIFT